MNTTSNPLMSDQRPEHYKTPTTPWCLQRQMQSSGNAFVDSRRADAIKYAFRMKGDKAKLADDLKKASHCLDAALAELNAPVIGKTPTMTLQMPESHTFWEAAKEPPPLAADDHERHLRSLRVNASPHWTDNELETIALLSKEKDLEPSQVIRQALRLYQLEHNRVMEGGTPTALEPSSFDAFMNAFTKAKHLHHGLIFEVVSDASGGYAVRVFNGSYQDRVVTVQHHLLGAACIGASKALEHWALAQGNCIEDTAIS